MANFPNRIASRDLIQAKPLVGRKPTIVRPKAGEQMVERNTNHFLAKPSYEVYPLNRGDWQATTCALHGALDYSWKPAFWRQL